MDGLLAIGPTRAAAEELRKQRGSKGLFAAIGEPMSYIPGPLGLIGNGLLAAQYATGEKPMDEGLASLSDMTAMAVGSRVPAPLRRIFAGVNAKTADKAKLARAEALDKAGTDNRAIWQQTGWFKGPDGKWRFEIDDSNSIPGRRSWGELEDLKQGNTTVTRRQSALAHPNLSAAYPDSKNIGVVLKPDAKDGSFSNDPAGFGATITAGAATNYGGKADRSVMLHELQHFVQDKEGFAKGGTPESAPTLLMLDQLKSVRAEKAKLNIDPYAIMNKRAGGYPLQKNEIEGLKKWEELIAKEDELLSSSSKVSPYEAYRRLGGEAEARAVQSRMDMTPKQRGLLFPLDSYDVPLDQLIFR